MNICKHCGRNTLHELVCSLTGNCYICEHPDWWRYEYHCNILRDFHGDPSRRPMNPEQEAQVGLRLDKLFPGIKRGKPWLSKMQFRYRNAEWGVKLMDGHHVYSLISLDECLQYNDWVRFAANEAGHIAVCPAYPWEGHRHANTQPQRESVVVRVANAWQPADGAV